MTTYPFTADEVERSLVAAGHPRFEMTEENYGRHHYHGYCNIIPCPWHQWKVYPKWRGESDGAEQE
jgi:hypothetical protein